MYQRDADRVRGKGGPGGVYRGKKRERQTVRKARVSENKERTKDRGGVVTK